MSTSRIKAIFRGRRGAVLCVALVVWGLALFDLTLIPRQGTPLLQALQAERLVGARVSPTATVVTSADPTSPVGPWVLAKAGDSVRVLGTQLPGSWRVRSLAHHVFHPRLVATVGRLHGAKPVDVDVWKGDDPALFAIASPRRDPTLSIYSLRKPVHLALRTKLPLPEQVSDRRDFFVATWSGRLPDLFVIDRDAQRRGPPARPSTRPWSIRVYSGESGFRRQIEHSLLRPKLSRRISKYAWWLDIAPRRKTKPNLIFITRSRPTGSGRVEIHMLSGKKRFHGFSLHTATELPQRLGSLRRFVFQPRPRGGAVLMVEVKHGQLSLRPLPLP